VQEIRDVVVEVFNSWAKLYKQWLDGEIEHEPSLPKVDSFTVRMNVPRVCSIIGKGKEFPFFFKVKVNGEKNDRIVIPVECGEYQRRLLKDALNGKYKLGAVQLVRRGGWFYFVVTIKKEVEIKPSEKIVGVDIGLRYQAVIVLHENSKISNVEFVKYRRLLDKVRYLWRRIDYL